MATKGKVRRGHEEALVVAPDSTTRERECEFSTGQDVLLKQKDGRYYLGTLVEVDCLREQCLVKFGDNTEAWSSFKDLTKLSTPQQEDLLCVGCKKSAPKDKREIAVCDKCGRGYHRKCHQPEIPTDCFKDETPWMCKRCLPMELQRQRRSDSIKQLKRDSFTKSSASSGNETPYLTTSNPKVLPYDLNSLNWDTYHRVNTEHTYCYCGDNGEWYKQMLQCGKCKQWFHERCLDCLHYPLYCGDRFYVFVCTICNHGKEFLRRLEMKWVDLVHLMLFNLTAYNSKKYYDLDTIIIPYVNDNWHALQLPPKISSVSRSERRDNILSILTNNRNRFKCGREIKKRTTIWGLRVRLPPPAPTITLNVSNRVTDTFLRELWQGNRRLQFLNSPPAAIVTDNHMRSLMMGVAYQSNTNNISESESSCPSPEVDREEPILSGCAKKTVAAENVCMKRQLKRGCSKKNLEEGGYVTRLSVDKSGDSMPLTPPTSVSAPPTPPASTNSNSLLSDDFSEKATKDKDDTSGDETSSKSTLDLIIPPPKDFEGKNNPFLALLRGGFDDKSKRRSKDSITLPLPLTAVIPGKPVMRPTKRQLSEKDIFIGPNGEVKRRRLRRGRAGLPTVYHHVTASKTATVVPAKSGDTCLDFNGRRLRQRPEKLSIEKDNSKAIVTTQPSPKPSPVKQEPEISMDDLKSSVNIYFGAANRIATGERFTVKAQRIGPIGKLEFLIEWDGPGSNGMT